MLIRKQGNLIKVLRVTPPTQPPTRGRRRENVVGIFRADEAIPSALLDALRGSAGIREIFAKIALSG